MTDTCTFRPLRDLAIVFIHNNEGSTPWSGDTYTIELWMRPHVALGDEKCEDEDDWDTIPIREVPTIEEAQELRQGLYQSGLLDERLLMAWAALLGVDHDKRVLSRVTTCPG